MDYLETKVSRVLSKGIDPERLSVRTLALRRTRLPNQAEVPYRVPPQFSDGRHTACEPTRCPGCRGLVIELPCRLCEVREGKASGVRRQASGE